jgi:DNA primase
MQRVILPVYGDGKLIWYQGRAITAGQKPKYLNPTVPKDGRMFISQENTELTGSTVIVCEDILSAIRVGKVAEANKIGVGVSLLGTKLCTESIIRLGNAERVIGWFDNDAAGRTASRDLYQSVSMLTDVHIIRSERDPKRYSDQEILTYLKGVV